MFTFGNENKWKLNFEGAINGNSEIDGFLKNRVEKDFQLFEFI